MGKHGWDKTHTSYEIKLYLIWDIRTVPYKLVEKKVPMKSKDKGNISQIKRTNGGNMFLVNSKRLVRGDRYQDLNFKA